KAQASDQRHLAITAHATPLRRHRHARCRRRPRTDARRARRCVGQRDAAGDVRDRVTEPPPTPPPFPGTETGEALVSSPPFPFPETGENQRGGSSSILVGHAERVVTTLARAEQLLARRTHVSAFSRNLREIRRLRAELAGIGLELCPVFP